MLSGLIIIECCFDHLALRIPASVAVDLFRSPEFRRLSPNARQRRELAGVGMWPRVGSTLWPVSEPSRGRDREAPPPATNIAAVVQRITSV